MYQLNTAMGNRNYSDLSNEWDGKLILRLNFTADETKLVHEMYKEMAKKTYKKEKIDEYSLGGEMDFGRFPRGKSI